MNKPHSIGTQQSLWNNCGRFRWPTKVFKMKGDCAKAISVFSTILGREPRTFGLQNQTSYFHLNFSKCFKMTGKINLIRVVFSIIKTLIIRHTQNLSGPDFLNFIIFSFNFSSTETLRIKTLFFGEKYIKRCLYIYIYMYIFRQWEWDLISTSNWP